MCLPADAPVSAPCPCGLGMSYAECCGRWHRRFADSGEPAAPTAEALMRSRYTAFALLGELDPEADHETAESLAGYLAATWAPENRPVLEDLLPTAACPNARFTRLQVLTVRDGGPFHSIGLVEFVALGVNDAGRFRLHELSRFRREGGVWLYIDGVVEES